jgi:hypothetical protein
MVSIDCFIGENHPKNHLPTYKEMGRWGGFGKPQFGGSGGRYARPPRMPSDTPPSLRSGRSADLLPLPCAA